MQKTQLSSFRCLPFGMVLAVLMPAIVLAQSQPNSVDINNGQALYQKNCASCHGVNLEGQENWRSPGEDGVYPAPPHDFSGHTWHHGDGLLFDYIVLGGSKALAKQGVDGFQSGMPGFSEGLSDQQIWDILAYIKSTWPRQAQEIQQERTKAEEPEGN